MRRAAQSQCANEFKPVDRFAGCGSCVGSWEVVRAVGASSHVTGVVTTGNERGRRARETKVIQFMIDSLCVSLKCCYNTA